MTLKNRTEIMQALRRIEKRKGRKVLFADVQSGSIIRHKDNAEASYVRRDTNTMTLYKVAVWFGSGLVIGRGGYIKDIKPDAIVSLLATADDYPTTQDEAGW
jgi:hypothetical protein